MHHESECNADCWTGIKSLKQLNEMLDKAYREYDAAKGPAMKGHYRLLIQRIEAGIDARSIKQGAK